jgi:hypothetical protein
MGDWYGIVGFSGHAVFVSFPCHAWRGLIEPYIMNGCRRI